MNSLLFKLISDKIVGSQFIPANNGQGHGLFQSSIYFMLRIVNLHCPNMVRTNDFPSHLILEILSSKGAPLPGYVNGVTYSQNCVKLYILCVFTLQ